MVHPSSSLVCSMCNATKLKMTLTNCVDAWEKYIEIIPQEERGNVMQAYHKRLTSDDQAVREQAASVSRASSVTMVMTALT